MDASLVASSTYLTPALPLSFREKSFKSMAHYDICYMILNFGVSFLIAMQTHAMMGAGLFVVLSSGICYAIAWYHNHVMEEISCRQKALYESIHAECAKIHNIVPSYFSISTYEELKVNLNALVACGVSYKEDELRDKMVMWRKDLRIIRDLMKKGKYDNRSLAILSAALGVPTYSYNIENYSREVNGYLNKIRSALAANSWPQEDVGNNCLDHFTRGRELPAHVSPKDKIFFHGLKIYFFELQRCLPLVSKGLDELFTRASCLTKDPVPAQSALLGLGQNFLRL